MNQHIENFEKLNRFGPRYVVFLLFLAAAFSFVDRQILSILFEPIKAEFDLSDTQLGLSLVLPVYTPFTLHLKNQFK